MLSKDIRKIANDIMGPEERDASVKMSKGDMEVEIPDSTWEEIGRQVSEGYTSGRADYEEDADGEIGDMVSVAWEIEINSWKDLDSLRHQQLLLNKERKSVK